MRKRYTLKNKNKETFTSKRFVINKKFSLLFCACLFVAFQVFSTIQSATSGAHIAYLEEEIDKLTKDNRELEDTLVKSTSLLKLQEKAKEMGFTKSENTYFIKGGDSFAKLP